jgi:hypothetical protein
MAEDLRATLLSMLMTRSSGQGAATLRETLIARIGERPLGDPLRAALSRALGEGPVAASANDSVREMRALLRAAQTELRAQQSRTGALALALGACEECWGDDSGCARCGGLGKPGWVLPDRAAFAVWIEPAIRSLAGVSNPQTENVLPFARDYEDPR